MHKAAKEVPYDDQEDTADFLETGPCPELFPIVLVDLWCCLHTPWLRFHLNDPVRA